MFFFQCLSFVVVACCCLLLFFFSDGRGRKAKKKFEILKNIKIKFYERAEENRKSLAENVETQTLTKLVSSRNEKHFFLVFFDRFMRFVQTVCL